MEKEDSLYKEIQQKRLELAQDEGVPAYRIFDNKTIEGLVANLPVSRQELLDVRGFGEARAEKYGDIFLELIANYKEKNLKDFNENNAVKTPENCQTKGLIKNKKEIEKAIFAFIEKFSGLFGKLAIAKLLTGNSDLLDNPNNDKVLSSEYFGIISADRFSTVAKIIEYLINNKLVEKTSGISPCLKLSSDFIAQKSKKEDNKYLDEIIEYINNGKNVFITGYAGTGKSYILNKLKQKYKKLEVTSTTGLAAVNVKGQTIHAWAGVGICNKPIHKAVDDIIKKSPLKKRLIGCKLLAIDEISMLDAKTLNYIDTVLRLVREDDSPFGGIQVLFFGDFFQLPPVDKDKDIAFCFESEIWQELSLKTVFLEKIYRQQDQKFIKVLGNMRVNNLTKEDIELLKTRELQENTDDSDILHIFSTNEEADRYNKFKFNSLENSVHTFKSNDGIYRAGKFVEYAETELNTAELISLENLQKNCRAPEILEFKLGSKVMLLVNLDFERGLINGSCGTIKEINKDSIIIQFDNGEKEALSKQMFEYYWNDKLVAGREQFPLKLAYGITIHKSQGMTLDKLVVDCNRIFEAGQAYVALSRIKSLDGLYLKSFRKDKVRVNEKVVNFYKNLK